MSHTFGRQVTYAGGYPIMVAAEALSSMRWKTGGVTLDWTTIAPYNGGAGGTLADGTPVPAGQLALEYGTVLTLITATGKYGPFTSASPAATTTVGASIVGATSLTLASAAGLFPGKTITVDVAGQAETLVIAAINGNVITTTTAATKTHANGVAVTGVDDGRQLLNPGQTFVLNESRLQIPPPGIGAAPSDNPPVLYGGSVWLARLKVGGANQPTLTQLLAACPTFQPISM